MALLLTLGRGALTGIGKRPSAGAALPRLRLAEPEVRIDPARMARYAEVCGYSPAADRVPLTYPHILGFPLAARVMAARDFPLPLMGLVHTSIEITAHRPLTVDDRPEIAVHAEELRPHRRGTEAVLVTEARIGGAAVWTDRSTYLARHAADRPPEQHAGPEAGQVSGPGADGARDADADGGRNAEADGGRDSGQDAGGALPAVEEWRLPAGLGRQHARVSGDYNPIHLHALTARPLGFSRAIAHGMWTVARCAAALDLTERVRAQFRAPVPLPSTVTFAASGDRFELRSHRGVHLTGSS
ncbi:putative dehydratase [Actinacidiphila reveromycinica]|uniref:Putative dehydratase n=1 Tax=Actinacidiphila reveromycinica TaxID=659352 RepID=A0A7U3UV27_9ACTN|nr:MaoC/PaaZ C-terminal domain-containing protein [Streptomyces sp. SN-593]BBA99407.1 putative dehydratase [Streptomyces sp. SN-593]